MYFMQCLGKPKKLSHQTAMVGQDNVKFFLGVLAQQIGKYDGLGRHKTRHDILMSSQDTTGEDGTKRSKILTRDARHDKTITKQDMS